MIRVLSGRQHESKNMLVVVARRSMEGKFNYQRTYLFLNIPWRSPEISKKLKTIFEAVKKS